MFMREGVVLFIDERIHLLQRDVYLLVRKHLQNSSSWSRRGVSGTNYGNLVAACDVTVRGGEQP